MNPAKFKIDSPVWVKAEQEGGTIISIAYLEHMDEYQYRVRTNVTQIYKNFLERDLQKI